MAKTEDEIDAEIAEHRLRNIDRGGALIRGEELDQRLGRLAGYQACGKEQDSKLCRLPDGHKSDCIY
jgi:hypothetical protein